MRGLTSDEGWLVYRGMRSTAAHTGDAKLLRAADRLRERLMGPQVVRNAYSPELTHVGHDSKESIAAPQIIQDKYRGYIDGTAQAAHDANPVALTTQPTARTPVVREGFNSMMRPITEPRIVRDRYAQHRR